jgi:LPXTG-motif cell wall-anchored protein
MPDTAANWVTLLLGGGFLSGAGLALRRKRQRPQR